jgi:hypothetical protein
MFGFMINFQEVPGVAEESFLGVRGAIIAN